MTQSTSSSGGGTSTTREESRRVGSNGRKVFLAVLVAVVVIALLVWPDGSRPSTRSTPIQKTRTLKVQLPALPASVEQVHVVFCDQTQQVDFRPKSADVAQTVEIQAPSETTTGDQEILIEVTQAGTRRTWAHLNSPAAEPELRLPQLPPPPLPQQRPFRSAFSPGHGQGSSERAQEIQRWRASHPAPRVPRR